MTDSYVLIVSDDCPYLVELAQDGSLQRAFGPFALGTAPTPSECGPDVEMTDGARLEELRRALRSDGSQSPDETERQGVSTAPAAGTTDIQATRHVWAGPADGSGPWHRVAWRDGGSSDAQLVALCGQVLASAGLRLEEPHSFTDGIGCGECAAIVYEQATGLRPFP